MSGLTATLKEEWGRKEQDRFKMGCIGMHCEAGGEVARDHLRRCLSSVERLCLTRGQRNTWQHAAATCRSHHSCCEVSQDTSEPIAVSTSRR